MPLLVLEPPVRLIIAPQQRLHLGRVAHRVLVPALVDFHAVDGGHVRLKAHPDRERARPARLRILEGDVVLTAAIAPFSKCRRRSWSA